MCVQAPILLQLASLHPQAPPFHPWHGWAQPLSDLESPDYLLSLASSRLEGERPHWSLAPGCVVFLNPVWGWVPCPFQDPRYRLFHGAPCCSVDPNSLPPNICLLQLTKHLTGRYSWNQWGCMDRIFFSIVSWSLFCSVNHWPLLSSYKLLWLGAWNTIM